MEIIGIWRFKIVERYWNVTVDPVSQDRMLERLYLYQTYFIYRMLFKFRSAL